MNLPQVDDELSVSGRCLLGVSEDARDAGPQNG